MGNNKLSNSGVAIFSYVIIDNEIGVVLWVGKYIYIL